MPEKIETLPAALARIAELEKQVEKLQAATNPRELSAREKKILDRMNRGPISRAAAEQAESDQENDDRRRAVEADRRKRA